MHAAAYQPDTWFSRSALWSGAATCGVGEGVGGCMELVPSPARSGQVSLYYIGPEKRWSVVASDQVGSDLTWPESADLSSSVRSHPNTIRSNLVGRYTQSNIVLHYYNAKTQCNDIWNSRSFSDRSWPKMIRSNVQKKVGRSRALPGKRTSGSLKFMRYLVL